MSSEHAMPRVSASTRCSAIPACVRGVGDRLGPARHPRPDGVEERVVDDLDAARAQARGEHGGHAVGPRGRSARNPSGPW